MKVKVIKNGGSGGLVIGPIIYLIQLSGRRVQKILLTEGGVPKDPNNRRHAQEEEGRMTPKLLPFIQLGTLHTPTFCLPAERITFSARPMTL